MPQARSELAAACVQTNYHILSLLRIYNCRTICSLSITADVFQSRPLGSKMQDLEKRPLARGSSTRRIKPCQFCWIIILRKFNLLAFFFRIVLCDIEFLCLSWPASSLLYLQASQSWETSSKLFIIRIVLWSWGDPNIFGYCFKGLLITNLKNIWSSHLIYDGVYLQKVCYVYI